MIKTVRLMLMLPTKSPPSHQPRVRLPEPKSEELEVSGWRKRREPRHQERACGIHHHGVAADPLLQASLFATPSRSLWAAERPRVRVNAGRRCPLQRLNPQGERRTRHTSTRGGRLRPGPCPTATPARAPHADGAALVLLPTGDAHRRLRGRGPQARPRRSRPLGPGPPPHRTLPGPPPALPRSCGDLRTRRRTRPEAPFAEVLSLTFYGGAKSQASGGPPKSENHKHPNSEGDEAKGLKFEI